MKCPQCNGSIDEFRTKETISRGDKSVVVWAFLCPTCSAVLGTTVPPINREP